VKPIEEMNNLYINKKIFIYINNLSSKNNKKKKKNKKKKNKKKKKIQEYIGLIGL